jgi:hypothetical protein
MGRTIRRFSKYADIGIIWSGAGLSGFRHFGAFRKKFFKIFQSSEINNWISFSVALSVSMMCSDHCLPLSICSAASGIQPSIDYLPRQ